MGLQWDVYHLLTGAGFLKNPQYHGYPIMNSMANRYRFIGGTYHI